MQRRDFVTQTLTALFTAGIGLPLLSGQRKRPPNLVLLIGDDHSARVLGSYGNKRIKTPNLDRLAQQGTRFTSAFCQSPVCSASRQSLLTGTYPHQTGVNLLFTSFSEEKNHTIAEHLQTQGYRTAAIGKMHTNNQQPHGFQVRKDTIEYNRWLKQKGGPRLIPPDLPVRDMNAIKGFSVGQWTNPGLRPEPLYDADSLDTWLANEAISVIREPSESPFLLFVGFHAPHAPMNFPVEFAGRYQPDQMPTAAFGPADLPWTPAIFRDLTETQKREIVAGYYTCVEYLDKNVGLVLQAIDQSEQRDNTLVVYTSDHGYLLGDHNRFEKHTMWEPAVRTPLIVRMPQQKQAGVCDELVELVDLAPTFAEVADSPVLPRQTGKSLLPLLQQSGKRGQRPVAGKPFREAVFSEYLVDNMAMLRTDKRDGGPWKYVFSTNQYDLGLGYAVGPTRPTGYVQRLYNLRLDPDEQHNLANEPAHQKRVAKLRAHLISVFLQTHPDAAKLPPALTPEQTLAWFCEPRDEVSELEKRVFPDPKRYKTRPTN